MWQACLEIQRDRLYRETHSNFRDYFKERFDLGKAHLYRLIGAAEVVQNLSPRGDTQNSDVVDNTFPLPQSERQARPLTRLSPEDQRSAWRDVVEEYGSRPTHNEVAKIAGHYQPEPLPVDDLPPILEPILPGSEVRVIDGKFDGFIGRVVDVARDSDLYWVKTPSRDRAPCFRHELELISAPEPEVKPAKLSPREQISGLKALLQATHQIIWGTASPTDELQAAVEKALE